MWDGFKWFLRDLKSVSLGDPFYPFHFPFLIETIKHFEMANERPVKYTVLLFFILTPEFLIFETILLGRLEILTYIPEKKIS